MPSSRGGPRCFNLGLFDGPELAVEVAKLEGLPATWTALNSDEQTQYERAELILTRAPEDWHLHNPYAEREARLAVEGFQSLLEL